MGKKGKKTPPSPPPPKKPPFVSPPNQPANPHHTAPLERSMELRSSKRTASTRGQGVHDNDGTLQAAQHHPMAFIRCIRSVSAGAMYVGGALHQGWYAGWRFPTKGERSELFNQFISFDRYVECVIAMLGSHRKPVAEIESCSLAGLGLDGCGLFVCGVICMIEGGVRRYLVFLAMEVDFGIDCDDDESREYDAVRLI
jgi:hypothetical protein